MIYIYWQSYFLTCCCPWTLCQCSSCQDESPAHGHVARVWLRLLRWFCICICFECSFCWPKAKPKQGIFLFVGCLFADVVVFSHWCCFYALYEYRWLSTRRRQRIFCQRANCSLCLNPSRSDRWEFDGLLAISTVCLGNQIRSSYTLLESINFMQNDRFLVI